MANFRLRVSSHFFEILLLTGFVTAFLFSYNQVEAAAGSDNLQNPSSVPLSPLQSTGRQLEDKDRDEDNKKKPTEKQVLESVGPILKVFEDLMSSWVKVATDFIAQTTKSQRETRRHLNNDKEGENTNRNSGNLNQELKLSSDKELQAPELLEKVVEGMGNSQENSINREDAGAEVGIILRGYPLESSQNGDDGKLEKTEEQSKVIEQVLKSLGGKRRKKRCSADAKAYYKGRDVSPDYYSGKGAIAQLYQQNPNRRPGWKRRKRREAPAILRTQSLLRLKRNPC